VFEAQEPTGTKFANMIRPAMAFLRASLKVSAGGQFCSDAGEIGEAGDAGDAGDTGEIELSSTSSLAEGMCES